MKKITLTLGVLAFSMLGLTSCVDNDVAPEVKAIYENQAKLLASQTTLKEAEAAKIKSEADLQAAKVAYQGLLNKQQELINESLKAKNEADKAKYEAEIAKQQALIETQKIELEAKKRADELAKLRHAQALIDLARELKEKNIDAATGVNGYASKYLGKMAEIQGKESQIAYKNIELTNLETQYNEQQINKDAQIKNFELNIAAATKGVEADKERLANLEAILASPNEAQKMSLALIKKVDSIKKVNDDKVLEYNRLNDQRNAITTSWPSLNDYNQALNNLKSTQRNLHNREIQVVDAEKAIATINEKLVELGATATTTYDEALDMQTAAQADVNPAQQALNKANDELMAANQVQYEYDQAIYNLTFAEQQLASQTTNKTTQETALAKAKTDYNNAKAAFDANSTGNSLDPYMSGNNADGKIGDLNDNSPVTYHKITAYTPASGTTPASFTFDATAYKSVQALLAADANAVYSETTVTVGEYRNVEADDMRISNAQWLSVAQNTLNNLKDAVNTATSEVDRLTAEVKQLKDDINSKYHPATIAENKATAEANLATAQENFNKANEKYNNASEVVNILSQDYVWSQYGNKQQTETWLAESKQIIEYYKSEVTRLEAVVAEAKAKVTDADMQKYLEARAERIALWEKMQENLAERNVNSAMINDYNSQITFLNAIDVLNARGADYEATIKMIESSIKAQKHAIVESERNLESLQNTLAALKQDKLDIDAYKAEKIAQLQTDIAKLQGEIEVLTKEAAAYKKLMEEALATV